MKNQLMLTLLALTALTAACASTLPLLVLAAVTIWLGLQLHR